jgi:hypothetical protein
MTRSQPAKMAAHEKKSGWLERLPPFLELTVFARGRADVTPLKIPKRCVALGPGAIAAPG